jgi:hypothetical protein
MPCRAIDGKQPGDRLNSPKTMFTHDEKVLLERAYQVRERQTDEERAKTRAEFEENWPALVAYIKDSEAKGKTMKGAVLCALGEAPGGPSIEKIVWYLLDRAVLSTKRAA